MLTRCYYVHTGVDAYVISLKYSGIFMPFRLASLCGGRFVWEHIILHLNVALQLTPPAMFRRLFGVIIHQYRTKTTGILGATLPLPHVK